MRTAAKVLRCCFAITGFFTILAAATGLRTAGAQPEYWVSTLPAMTIAFAMATVSLTAWWKLRSGAPTARRWAIGASILLLPMLLVGNPTGPLGLAIFSQRKLVAAAVCEKKQKPPRIPGDGTRKWIEWGAFAVLLPVMWTIDSWFNAWAVRSGVPQPAGLSQDLQIFGGIMLAVAFHEAGHAIAGMAMNMKLVHLAVGPLVFRLRGSRIEMRFDWKGLLGGGAAGLVPRSIDGFIRRQIIVIAAGPAASVLVCAAATAATLLSPGTPLASAWLMLSVLALLSLIGGPWNLIPMQGGPLYSDGAQLYQLLSDGPWADAHLARAMVANSLVSSVRPRDWDAEILERSAAGVDRGIHGLLHRMYLCMHHLDAGRMQEAAVSFGEVARLYHESDAETDADLAAEILFVSALLFRNPAAARIWWDRVEAKKNSSKKLDYWRALAALSWLESDRDRAAASLAMAEEFVRQLPPVGAYDYDRDSVLRLRIAIEESSPQSPGVSRIPEFI